MDKDVEFFLYKGRLMFLHDGRARSFEKITPEIRYHLEEMIADNPDVDLCLDCLDLHEPLERLRQFVICRFASFDTVADLTEGGEGSPEFTLCDKRGRCPFEGTLCQPLTNNYSLSFREIQVIRVMASGLPNKLMVDDLGISINTINTHIQNICHKLEVRSKAEILLWAMKHHIIDELIEQEEDGKFDQIRMAQRPY